STALRVSTLTGWHWPSRALPHQLSAARRKLPCFTKPSWRIAMRKVDPKVEEAIETLNMKDGPTRRKLLTSTGLVSASAAASALLTACGSSAPAKSTTSSVAGNFPKTPAWQFWFVNHVTTNLFFVPTISGTKDAAALLSIPTPKWGGSQN